MPFIYIINIVSPHVVCETIDFHFISDDRGIVSGSSVSSNFRCFVYLKSTAVLNEDMKLIVCGAGFMTRLKTHDISVKIW
jgi:hypothetical protein